MRAIDYARLLRGWLTPEVPVEVERLPRILGIETALADLNHMDGYLRCEAGKRLIVINRRRSLVRRRFTLAHEIGHLLLSPYSPLTLPPEPIKNMEVAANQFAANLLMPEELVMGLWEMYSSNTTHREEIVAERLLVSKTALKARMSELCVSEYKNHQICRRGDQ